MPDAITESRALYYPWIDVRDSSWLRSACLLWDTVSTIVPEGHEAYLDDADSSALATEGWLTPFEVDSYGPDVYEASRLFMAFLQSESWAAVLRTALPDGSSGPGDPPFQRLHSAKVSPDLLEFLGLDPYRPKAWLSVPKVFADLYVAVLATQIARQRRFAVVTDRPGLESLGNSSLFGLRSAGPVTARGTSLPSLVSTPFARSPGASEGLLMRFTFEGLSINHEAPIADVVSFRKDNQDGLDRLRTSIGELVGSMDGEYPSYDAFEQAVRDIYANRVRPKLKELRGLRSRALRKATPDFWKAAACAASPTLLTLAPIPPLAAPVGIAPGATAGVAMMRVSYASQLEELRSKGAAFGNNFRRE